MARTNVGVAAHITAASVGGPRFDSALTPEERQSIGNGIWLCQTHAKEIDDDEVGYPADLLRAWKKNAEEDARALIGKPISGQSLNVSLQLVLHRASDDSLLVVGSTNLPDGTKLWVELTEPDKPRQTSVEKTVVREGTFGASGFLAGIGKPYPHGWCEVRAVAYFNGPWQQPGSVIAIVGKEGEFLVGRFADPLHPEFEDSEKTLNAAFACIAPPLTDTPPRSPADLERATQIVKDAVLTVEGRVSSEPVAEVVRVFMESPGLRERDGWSAEALASGAVVVRFSYWNGPQPRPDVAEWIVILDSGDVRYRNLQAKQMSWLPNY